MKQSPKEIKLITSGIINMIKPQGAISYLMCRDDYWSLHVVNDHEVEINVINATIKVDNNIWNMGNPQNFDEIKRILAND